MNIDNVFSYHAPEPAQFPHYEAIRAAAKNLAYVIEQNTPSCADQAAAFRKLRDCVMTAEAAIALKGSL